MKARLKLRARLFRWETTFPDENLLVSDGQSLWYYSPFIEQVSIYWQEQATSQTPFVLLTRNQESDWDNYNVAQSGNQFTLTPTAVDSNQGDFQININEKGIVQGFNVIEQDGQKASLLSAMWIWVNQQTALLCVAPEGRGRRPKKLIESSRSFGSTSMGINAINESRDCNWVITA